MSVASRPSPMMVDMSNDAPVRMILPSPAAPFEWTDRPAGPALVCRPLAAVAPHLFTSQSWNLGRSHDTSGVDPWSEIAAAMHLDRDQLIRVHQVHGANVLVHRAGH